MQHSTRWLIPIWFLAAAVVRGEDRSPLVEASRRNDTAVAIGLIERQEPVSAVSADGMTALHWAAHHQNHALLERLLAAGAPVDAVNRYGVRPLSIACVNGSEADVAALLSAGANPNTPLRGGETPLMLAARTGKLPPVQALLSRGAAVDARDRHQQTALMWSAAEGHVAVVEALLAAGADIHATLDSGFTPFFFAVREGQTAAVLRLLQAGIDVQATMAPKRGNVKNQTSALILAVENGHFELAATLLKSGADPKDQRVGYTALHALTWVRKPIRGDGDPPPIGSGKLTSLELAKLLVSHGADVNARHTPKHAGGSRLNRAGATPLVLAAEASDLPFMKLLLTLGADPNLPNEQRSTPLLAAAGVGVLGDGDESAGTEEEAIQAVRLLLDSGANVNDVDDLGNTAMHGAAYQSRAKLVPALQEWGANPATWNRPNHRGWTPLQIAQGHRPGNFRPSPETIAAIERLLAASR